MIPETITRYYCPHCGKERPPAWGPIEDDDAPCRGEWWDNMGNAGHEATPWEAVEYRKVPS